MLKDMLRKAREDLGLNQDDVADGIVEFTGKKLTRQSVHNWESGKREPGKRWWVAIETVLRLESGAIYREVSEKDVGGKNATALPSPQPPADGFQTVMNELCAQLSDWVAEVEGRDTRAAIDFAEELYNRFPELRDWKKKQRQSGIAGTAPRRQDRKVANGNGYS